MLFDNEGKIFDLLGRFDIGHGTSFGAEGHQDAENQDRYPEKHKRQEDESSDNEGGQNRLPALLERPTRAAAPCYRCILPQLSGKKVQIGVNGYSLLEYDDLSIL